MMMQDDDFDAELEQARKLLSRSLGREEKPEQSGQLYRLQREPGNANDPADESFLVERSGKVNIPRL